MIKKTVTYTDYNGNTRTEDFYFDLSEDNILEMAVSKDGGMEEFLRRIIQEKDQGEMVRLFRELLRLTYGEKSDDGKYFIQNDAVFEKFKSTRAYEKIFMELAFNSDAAADFVNKVIPSDLAEKIAKYRGEMKSQPEMISTT